MKLEYKVTDKNGLSRKMWAYGDYSANGVDRLSIRDIIINTLDLSLEPYTINRTGNFKHDNNLNVIEAVL